MITRLLMPFSGAVGCAAPLAIACACGVNMAAQSLPLGPAGSTLGTGLLVGAAAALGAALGLALWWTEWRWAWLRRFLLLPLWSRLDDEKLNAHDTRAQLLAEIRSQPGQATRRLAKTMHVNMGTLLYHLRVLERAQRVSSRRVGRMRVWDPVGKAPDPRLDALQEPSRKALWTQLQQTPGSSAAEVAQRLGLSRGTVHHHVGQLARAGLVRIERHGGRTRLFAIA